MSWIIDHVRKPKDADYARRSLDRYRRGMKGRGAIRGVRIIPGSEDCPTCRPFVGVVYHPDEAPIIPIAGCTLPEGCCCAYTAAMTYEEGVEK
jgi:hypothetical protein